MRRRRERSQRGWERDLLREIRLLETTDEGHDGPVTPITGRISRPRRRLLRARPAPLATGERRRTERTRTLWTVGLTLVVLALGVASFGPAAPFIRRVVGLGPSGGDGHDYAFIHTDSRGRPGGFDPCKDIHYEVNPTLAPADWESVVSDSITAVSAATGLIFVDDGTTTDDSYFDRRTFLTGSAEPVLIGWTTADRVQDLDGDVAGVTSSDYDTRSHRFDTGRVVLDADAYAQIARQPGGRSEELAILMHELGHLVGLAHVDDPNELMYPTVGTRSTYGPGDLEGLRRIGALHC